MKLPFVIPFAVLLSASFTPDGPAVHSRWQRILVPPQPLSQAEQCVVLDADLYAHAAPGLRDVRLMQDAREIPYATDVSFDDRTGEAGAPPPDDRAQYETVSVLPLSQGSRADGSGPSPGYYYTEDLLSAHIPAERVRLEPAPKSETLLSLRAAARMNLPQAEELRATLGPGHAAAPFTIGANLQDEADIMASVQTKDLTAVPKSVVLEMRRREICYQPVSSAPVRLLLGNPAAEPVHYEYALHFQPKASPLLATMGPMEPNPDYRAPGSRQTFRMTARRRLMIAAFVAIATFFLTAVPLLRFARR